MGLPLGQRTTRCADDFESAGNARRVCGCQAQRRCGIFFSKGSVRIGDGKGADMSTHRRVDLRNGRDAIQKRADVKARAADEDGEFPAGMGSRDFGAGFGGPAGCGTGLRTVDMAEQAVRRAGHIVG